MTDGVTGEDASGAGDLPAERPVLDLTADVPVVLRPGAVTLEQLRDVLPRVIGAAAPAAKP